MRIGASSLTVALYHTQTQLLKFHECNKEREEKKTTPCAAAHPEWSFEILRSLER
jgi:hypothetical protein